MKHAVLIPVSLALAMSLVACDRASAPAAENAAAAPEAAAADKDAVKQAFSKFNADIAAKNVDAIKAQYASDAVMVLPDQQPFVGLDAIVGDYTKYAADTAGKYEPGEEKVEAAGDVALAEVKYKTTFTNPKTKSVETAERYNLSVYKKQPDGSWKIVRDINVDLPKAS